MLSTRLSLAAERGLTALPEGGRVCVIGARAGDDLSVWTPDAVQVVQEMKPDHDALARAGWSVARAPEGPFDLAVAVLPRAKEAALDRVARAAELADRVLVDGQKTDGIESVLKALRGRAEIGEVISKAHGKLGDIRNAAIADWRAEAAPNRDGFVTRPGVFSAGGIDRASALLAEALPEGLKGSVADLGAGWGYLACRVLEHPGVAECHLVEADAAALDCARVNVSDERARFHWADATRGEALPPVETVVCNPPFHLGRAPDPALGQGFIAAAASCLAPQGALWLVANRHLPYERVLRDRFAEVAEAGGDGAFKIFRARPPRKGARR